MKRKKNDDENYNRRIDNAAYCHVTYCVVYQLLFCTEIIVNYYHEVLIVYQHIRYLEKVFLTQKLIERDVFV